MIIYMSFICFYIIIIGFFITDNPMINFTFVGSGRISPVFQHFVVFNFKFSRNTLVINLICTMSYILTRCP